ncbi:hypothetical protein B296_00046273 [Ensete ventricosum]|uniref:Uncharacterized protein n=1 Tax=Ensete ventricosum TaxID=4639 RepID=A0A426XXZ0_ENSVE|nr:hypothetical protein B296_00046273 [Ensete ventricosum]
MKTPPSSHTTRAQPEVDRASPHHPFPSTQVLGVIAGVLHLRHPERQRIRRRPVGASAALEQVLVVGSAGVEQLAVGPSLVSVGRDAVVPRHGADPDAISGRIEEVLRRVLCADGVRHDRYSDEAKQRR